MMAAVERHTTPSRPRRAAGAPPTLEAAGRRSTPQREAVYRYLAGIDPHPTAKEVYLAGKRRVPSRRLDSGYTARAVPAPSWLAGQLTKRVTGAGRTAR